MSAAMECWGVCSHELSAGASAAFPIREPGHTVVTRAGRKHAKCTYCSLSIKGKGTGASHGPLCRTALPHLTPRPVSPAQGAPRKHSRKAMAAHPSSSASSPGGSTSYILSRATLSSYHHLCNRGKKLLEPGWCGLPDTTLCPGPHAHAASLFSP